MADPIEINLWQGEIAELEVDAIIIPSSESLFMTGAVARAVKLRAGEGVEREAVDQGPAAGGSAIVTGAGALPARHVIHLVAVGHDLRADPERLGAAYGAAFDAAERIGARRLATTPIGTERGVFTPEDAAAVLLRVLRDREAGGAWLPESLVIVAGNRAEMAALGSLTTAMRTGPA
jgi:O-acetyl-ADP-ribose deacetylase